MSRAARQHMVGGVSEHRVMQRAPRRPVTRKQFDYKRRQLEQSHPVRRYAVLELIAFGEQGYTPPNRAERRATKPLRRQGHPARTTARQRRKHWHDPSPREAQIRELNRLMRREAERAGEEHSEITGPIGVVATYAAPILLGDAGLDVEEHRYPFEHWLRAKLEDVLRTLDADGCDIDGYHAWREATLEKLRETEVVHG